MNIWIRCFFNEHDKSWFDYILAAKRFTSLTVDSIDGAL